MHRCPVIVGVTACPSLLFRELLPLFDVNTNLLAPLRDDEPVPHDDIDAIVGDMLSMRMADAMADRSVTRSLQYLTAMAVDAAAANGVNSIELRAARSFHSVAYVDPGAVVVALASSREGKLRVLVSADLLQMPVAPHVGQAQPRDSAVNLAHEHVTTRRCRRSSTQLTMRQ